MALSEVQALLADQTAMEKDRPTWEANWQEICEFMDPQQADFYGTKTPGQKRSQKIFDSTAPVALERFAAIMESILTPQPSVWHRLKPQEGAAEPGSPFARWLDQVNQLLYDYRYSPAANFSSQQHQNYRGLGSIGTASLYVDAAPGYPLRYRSCHMSEIYIAQTSWGDIDKVNRKFKLQARQVLQDYKRHGDEIPDKIRTTAEHNPLQEFTFLHCVDPNEERDRNRPDHRGMPWRARTVCLDTNTVVRRGGFRTFPWMVSRYTLATREVYGRSPGWMALADTKTLGRAAKSRLRQWDRELDPAWATAEDVYTIKQQPGAVNPGLLDEQTGRLKAVPLNPNARFDIDAAVTEQLRGVVNDIFLITLFQILVDSPQMTATEVLERAREKGALTAPVMARQQSECLGPLIAREFDLLAFQNLLPEPPAEVLESGLQYQIDYVSPLATAAKAESGLSVMRAIDGLLPISERVPDIWDNFDTDDMARTYAESVGLKQSSIVSADIVAQRRQQRAQQQAMQEMAAAAPGLGSAVKDVAQAEQIATGA